MRQMERNTSWRTKLPDSDFDEGQKLAKFTTITPTYIYTYIAIAARNCEQHGEQVQPVEAQLLDPLTGLARGDKPPPTTKTLIGFWVHSAKGKGKCNNGEG